MSTPQSIKKSSCEGRLDQVLLIDTIGLNSVETDTTHNREINKNGNWLHNNSNIVLVNGNILESLESFNTSFWNCNQPSHNSLDQRNFQIPTPDQQQIGLEFSPQLMFFPPPPQRFATGFISFEQQTFIQQQPDSIPLNKELSLVPVPSDSELEFVKKFLL